MGSPRQIIKWTLACFSIFVIGVASQVVHGQSSVNLSIKKGDHICYVGNTMADRMQHHAWLETYIHALHPDHDLTFRNLGFAADEIKTRPRSASFGDPDQWLTKCKADVVFCFFGSNESLRGPSGLEKFETELEELIDHMKSQKYNGTSAPSLVFVSPIFHEDLQSDNLPDGTKRNQDVRLYSQAMADVCKTKDVSFVDAFSATEALYELHEPALTMNGIHLLDQGNRLLAQSIMDVLFPGTEIPADSAIAELRKAVLEKNLFWFSRYRVVDGYNVYGGRSTLAWFNQSNADVMKREMEIFDVMTENRDRSVWAVAKGEDYVIKDDNLPTQVVVKTNKQGPLADGAFPYLNGEEAIEKMTVHSNMKVNLFASEEMYPRLVNPVQMAVDTDSRIWVSAWESYPHWNPTERRNDALLILPDEDGDGVADECIVFADELNSVTGFEFWGGGVLVAAPPEIWFLKDTDGDDRADVKIRMLQGISSADTHHSANALVMGPDGWLYFSRGVFNVANFETPTKTYRSGTSGVHRFNPRTFEIEFHFPIGPNPHGDIFDQWGYQFANDGTGGTGSYVNIGKGIGNRKWFEKRMRPVSATAFLSSSHFPEKHQGNFLITNTIGFLGIMQHEVSYRGADVRATEIEPIVFSSDPNFRPSDMEVGGDGALYFSDWHNTLIGHMQHNMRDPNRDNTHGRIYRVTDEGRPLLVPAKMKGKPILEVCENFFALENGTRYRARLELSGRETSEVIRDVGQFASSLDPGVVTKGHDESQALLECLWIFEDHRVPNVELVAKTFVSSEPRVRAAAIRTLGHWSGRISGWEELLVAASKDENPLVRAESVKAAVDLGGTPAAEAIFEVSVRPLDPELETVLKYAKSKLNIGALVRQMINSGDPLSSAARVYILEVGTVEDLVRLAPSEKVYRAILSRKNASIPQLEAALAGLEKSTGTAKIDLLVQLIEIGQDVRGANIALLGKLLSSQPVDQLNLVLSRIEQLAISGKTPAVQRLAFAAWIAMAGPGDPFLAATQSKERLIAFLGAVPNVDQRTRGALFSKVMPLAFELPASLTAEPNSIGGTTTNGVEAGYYTPHSQNATIQVVDQREPSDTATIKQFQLFVPQGKTRDQFTNSFRAMVDVPATGDYLFFVKSDDGSRLFIDGEVVVNHDGDHGMTEKSGRVSLSAGRHAIRVNYFNSGGANGLLVSWRGPGFRKQEIPADRLFVGGTETLHDVAIHVLASIPDHDAEKFKLLCALVAQGKHQAAAISTLKAIPSNAWNSAEIKPLVNNLVGFLSAMPARNRTGPSAIDAMELAKSLGQRLSEVEQQDLEDRLKNLDVRVIAIGTVPHRMIYDKEMIVVEAGKAVEFRFSNTDSMPHNFAVVLPGSLQEVGELAEATGRDSDAVERHYIPVSDKILVASRLLQPGDEQAISFVVPTTPGVYPYVCTYPGHWRRMYGALYVVPSFESYQVKQELYLSDLDLEIKDELLTLNSRGQQWEYDDLIDDVKMPMQRSFEVGQASFRAANCIACHEFNGEGQNFGPDLAVLADDKRTPAHILRSIIEPSLDIDEKFSSTTFLLESGKTITGMITEENDDVVKVIIDPLAKDQVTVITQDEIEDSKKSKISPMPMGMVDKLSREEIIDLIAYVLSKGDPKHKMFEGHDHGGH